MNYFLLKILVSSKCIICVLCKLEPFQSTFLLKGFHLIWPWCSMNPPPLCVFVNRILGVSIIHTFFHITHFLIQWNLTLTKKTINGLKTTPSTWFKKTWTTRKGNPEVHPLYHFPPIGSLQVNFSVKCHMATRYGHSSDLKIILSQKSSQEQCDWITFLQI